VTASRIAKLGLDADWAVLSACNTAAGDKPGAEGLSGLARAFFYAGARSLLVSHWPVDSHATVRLTTGAFTELRKHPDIGRTEALRRSMQALIADRSSLRNADPSIWAPFVLVGEGS
jgi:CHAT domain-containing protein